MSEPTAKELAEWLAELPEEARPYLRLSVDGRWFEHSVYLTNHHHALALWFTAATLWLWENTSRVELSVEFSGEWRIIIQRERNLLSSWSVIGETPYHALAAAVRRVRAEEGGKR